MWIVPAARMKARKEHRVPLSHSAIAIINAMPADAEYLFPGTRPGKHMSKTAMSDLLESMGITETTHGFRSTFRDWGAEERDYPNELLEVAIGHKVANRVEAAYRRGDMLAKRHELMRDWERFCNGQS